MTYDERISLRDQTVGRTAALIRSQFGCISQIRGRAENDRIKGLDLKKSLCASCWEPRRDDWRTRLNRHASFLGDVFDQNHQGAQA